jgi:hypothetical protein
MLGKDATIEETLDWCAYLAVGITLPVPDAPRIVLTRALLEGRTERRIWSCGSPSRSRRVKDRRPCRNHKRSNLLEGIMRCGGGFHQRIVKLPHPVGEEFSGFRAGRRGAAGRASATKDGASNLSASGSTRPLLQKPFDAFSIEAPVAVEA